MKKLKMTETQLRNSILEYLEHKGHFVWKNNTGSFMVETRLIRTGLKGSSDIIGIHKDNGKFIAVAV